MHQYYKRQWQYPVMKVKIILQLSWTLFIILYNTVQCTYFLSHPVWGPFQTSSGEVSPVSVTPAGTPSLVTQAPKYGTLIPNRIFVGGIASNVSILVHVEIICNLL